MSADGADRVFVNLCNKAEVPFGDETLIISTCFKEILGDTGFQVAGADGDKIYVWTFGVGAPTSIADAQNCWRPAYNAVTDFIYFVDFTGLSDTYELRKIHPDGTSNSIIDTLSDVDDQTLAVYVDYDPDLDRIYVFHSDGHHNIKPDGTGLNDLSTITFTSLKGGTLLRDQLNWFVGQGTGHLARRELSDNNALTFVGGGNRNQATADDDLGYVFIRNSTTIQRRDSADLGNAVTIKSDLGTDNNAIYLDAASSKIYYVDDSDDMYKADLDGTNEELVQSAIWTSLGLGMKGMVFCK